MIRFQALQPTWLALGITITKGDLLLQECSSHVTPSRSAPQCQAASDSQFVMLAKQHNPVAATHSHDKQPRKTCGETKRWTTHSWKNLRESYIDGASTHLLFGRASLPDFVLKASLKIICHCKSSMLAAQNFPCRNFFYFPLVFKHQQTYMPRKLKNRTRMRPLCRLGQSPRVLGAPIPLRHLTLEIGIVRLQGLSTEFDDPQKRFSGDCPQTLSHETPDEFLRECPFKAPIHIFDSWPALVTGTRF